MKKNTVIAFIIGFVLGIIITFTGCYIIGEKTFKDSSELPSGLTLFKEGEHGNIFNEKQVKLFQVLAPNAALASIGDDILGTTVLYIGNKEDHFYDDQVIKAPKDKNFVQVGTYQYTNNSGIEKTVPVLKIK